MQTKIFEESGANFSDDRKHRFALWRIWDSSKPLVMFIGLNPSTANETGDDPTIKSVCRICKHNGYGGVYMMNCFSLVSTDPAALNTFIDTPFYDHEDMENMRWLLEVNKRCKAVVFAWGNFKITEQRAKSLKGYFSNALALGINKNGSPKHPLYIKSITEFQPFNF